MGKILVTGATGNVGAEVVSHLLQGGEQVKGCVYSLNKEKLPDDVEQVRFDFADRATFAPAFEGVDRLFLMRPPQIADVKSYLFPMIDYALEKKVRQIVFLSLQGVQFNVFTPHHKVERYMRKVKAPYTFIRPNFYMQNLVTFYKEDIRDRSEIFLPAGNGRTAFIDVRDIGAVAAEAFKGDAHIGKAYTLSGSEALDYWQVAQILSEVLEKKVTYKDPSVAKYVERMREQKKDEEFISVQKMLYLIVRFNFSSSTNSDVTELLGRAPTSFRKFAEEYRSSWVK